MRGEDAYKENYEHIELFDEPGLFTNGRIDRETVPAGWYCYDLRGNDDDPGDPTTVEEQVTVNHAGTVLLPKPLKLNRTDINGTRYRKISEGLNFLDGEITLEEFCREHGFMFPERKSKHVELITRLGESMIRRLLDVSEKNNKEKLDAAHAIRDYLNVHYHLVKEHQFTNAEVEALLEFADPLEVATACWEANTSADFDICDMLDKINAKSDYPLADGTVPEPYVPDGLPELCFSVLPGTGKLICIKRGESGYYPSDWETGNAEKNRETADYANEQLGITKEQELAMLHGSMVGWDTPGADPKTYENPPYSRMLNPKPKHKRQDKER